jgi:hypothetical protein
MSQVITRFPILVDARVLSVAAAVALAVVSLVASGDPAAAMDIIGGGGR